MNVSAADLAGIPLLAGLPEAVLERLADRMRRDTIPPGMKVVEEGRPGTRFYFVLGGTLEVSEQSQGVRKSLGRGAYFGEVALARGIPRTGSVRAVRGPASLASCDRETFDAIIRPLLSSPGLRRA